MSTDEGQEHTLEDTTPSAKPGVYSPVNIHASEAIGAFFLGAVALILLIGLLRAESRYSLLLSQLPG
jgi:hypothetical protein